MSKILVVGSLSFDVIFGIHGNIRDEIPLHDGKIRNINLMFSAHEKSEFFGGTAGNICYGLGLLQEHPMLFSVVGKDFETDYRRHLSEHGVKLEVIVKPDEFTATYYGISDEVKQQIGIWQTNAYGKWINEAHLSDTLTEAEIDNIEVAIFSPGTGTSTENLLTEFRNKNKQATVIFDPSQELSISYTKKQVLACLDRADILIGNVVEFAQLKNLFQLTIPEVLAIGLKAVIETEGEKGVTIYQGNLVTHLDAFIPDQVLETTGAGDAFRAGLIHGLIRGESITDACKIGTYLGAKSVGEFGGQRYNIKQADLTKLIIKN